MITFVGQAPGRNGDPAKPLVGGRVGGKIMELMGPDAAKLERSFRRVNLLIRWPGKSGKGDAFPMDEARSAAIALLLDGELSGRVILLGKAVGRAFGIRDPKYFEWTDVSDCKMAVFPHPSGINHWWNSPENRRTAADFLRTTILALEADQRHSSAGASA